MWILRWIVSAVIILLILGFALYNMDQTVSVTFLKWKSPVLPLWFFLYISFGAGMLFWVAVSALNALKLKRENRSLERQYKKVKNELDRLRNVGIEEEMEPEPPSEEDSATLIES